MRICWKDLELPTRVLCETATATPTYGKFSIEPFEKGFGVTIGNSLRRVLLSSLEGGAVTGINIDGIKHEFSSIDGVMEDVTDIVLNVKQLVVRVEGDEARSIHIDVNKKGPVTAGDIETDPNVEIVNPDLVIANLTENVEFKMEMTVRRGRGFVTSEEHIEGEQEIGLIPVDSLFSPVTRVRYDTVDTRVGQRMNYDKLVMEIWTNATISPEMALVEAAKVLRKHLNPFVEYFAPGEELGIEAEEVEIAEAPVAEEYLSELELKLAMPISSMDLSGRATNCLEASNVFTVGEVVRMNEEQLLAIPNFGKTSLREVKRKLADLGLAIGMDLEGISASGGGGE